VPIVVYQAWVSGWGSAGGMKNPAMCASWQGFLFLVRLKHRPYA